LTSVRPLPERLADRRIYCLAPAAALLFEALCQAIERRLGIWPTLLVLAGVVACQLMFSQQRLALP
jgi:hypothetical protein